MRDIKKEAMDLVDVRPARTGHVQVSVKDPAPDEGTSQWPIAIMQADLAEEFRRWVVEVYEMAYKQGEKDQREVIKEQVKQYNKDLDMDRVTWLAAALGCTPAEAVVFIYEQHKLAATAIQEEVDRTLSPVVDEAVAITVGILALVSLGQTGEEQVRAAMLACEVIDRRFQK